MFKINNIEEGVKYLFSILAFILLVVIGSGIYEQIHKQKLGSNRLLCHQGVNVFEKVINKELLKKTKEHIKNNKVSFILSKKPSIYMKSELFHAVSMDKIEMMIKNQIGIHHISNTVEDVVVEVDVYENDKEDPKKKSEQCKIYAGYFVIAFFYKTNLAYKVQIDFFHKKAEDLEVAIACAFESFWTSI